MPLREMHQTLRIRIILKVIEIPDESILYTRDKETETGCSLSDIKVDDVVRIKYSDDGVTPEKIVVMTQSAPAGESETQTASAN